jgi:hypothetical protein
MAWLCSLIMVSDAVVSRTGHLPNPDTYFGVYKKIAPAERRLANQFPATAVKKTTIRLFRLAYRTMETSDC